MLPLFKRILTILFIANTQAGIDYTIIESTAQRLVLRIDIVPRSDDDCAGGSGKGPDTARCLAAAG